MERKIGLYEKYMELTFDIIGELRALIFLSWLHILIASLVRMQLWTPVLFVQHRPVKDEKYFKCINFAR